LWQGIARIGRPVLFVPFTAPGDTIVAEITEARRIYYVGRVVEMVAPSSQQTQPRCHHFGICECCHHQHIAYEHQLVIKEHQIRESFERIGSCISPPHRQITP
jgi:23S rRNA (uracil1939-C5)-methyltransferase